MTFLIISGIVFYLAMVLLVSYVTYLNLLFYQYRDVMSVIIGVLWPIFLVLGFILMVIEIVYEFVSGVVHKIFVRKSGVPLDKDYTS